MVHLFLLMPFQILFLSDFGLTIWSEINYVVLHQAKKLQGFASAAFATEHSAGSSSRSSEHNAVPSSSKMQRRILLTGCGSFVGYVLCNKS